MASSRPTDTPTATMSRGVARRIATRAAIRATSWTGRIDYVGTPGLLIGLSGYGLHRLSIIYLYVRHSRKRPVPRRQFEELPLITVQLPVFNEMHVVERLLGVDHGRTDQRRLVRALLPARVLR